MASSAFSGVGTKMYRATTEDGTYTAFSEVNNISISGMSQETIDVTSLDSIGGYREFIKSFRDAGEATFTMNFTNSNYDIVKSDFESDNAYYYKIVLPDDSQSTFSFAAFTTNIPVTIAGDDKVTADVTLKITGQMTFYAGSTTTTS